MPVWETRDLGVVRGCCASCGQVAELHLRESSYRRTWSEVLAEIDERVDRRVTCSLCRRTYPVRAEDDVSEGATRRSRGQLPRVAPGRPRRRNGDEPADTA